MKVAQFERRGVLNVIDKPLRSLRPDEVLVRVRVCGICGTDVHIVEGSSRSTPPIVLGHEYAGIVEEIGSEVTGFTRGQSVAVDPNIVCGTCYFCRRGEVHLCANLCALGVDRDGGMAEYSIVPVRQLYNIPEGMSWESSAFIEPLSCCIHGIDRAGIVPADTVVIIGGGTIGLLMLQLARLAGAAHTIVVEPLAHKRTIAASLGADLVLDPASVDVIDAVSGLSGVGADVVIECAGKAATARLAIDIARRGATVEFFGVCPIGETIPVEPNQVYFKELTIVGSYINPVTFARSIELLASGRISIQHFPLDTFSLDQVPTALEWQREGKTLKSIIQPAAHS